MKSLIQQYSVSFTSWIYRNYAFSLWDLFICYSLCMEPTSPFGQVHKQTDVVSAQLIPLGYNIWSLSLRTLTFSKLLYQWLLKTKYPNCCPKFTFLLSSANIAIEPGQFRKNPYPMLICWDDLAVCLHWGLCGPDVACMPQVCHHCPILISSEHLNIVCLVCACQMQQTLIV